MASIIVNDASCLIDLRKGQLLHVMLSLPYRFIVPYPVRMSELLDFTPQEWRILDDGGLVTFDLPSDAVGRALEIKAERLRLSANDCFCLVTTGCHEDSLLLTGDQDLQTVACEMGVETHGVLWLLDRLNETGNGTPDLLVTALEVWRNDPAVFLPPDEIDMRLRALRRLMRRD